MVHVGHSMGCLDAIRESTPGDNVVLIAPAIPPPSKVGCGGKHGRALRRVAVKPLRFLAKVVGLTVFYGLYPLLFVTLRRLVSSRKFWKRGLGAACEMEPSGDMIERYMRPSLCSGWEGRLLNFIRDGGALSAKIVEADFEGKRVLVLLPKDDKVVSWPYTWPGEVKEIEGGHIVHEERANEVAGVVRAWVGQ